MTDAPGGHPCNARKIQRIASVLAGADSAFNTFISKSIQTPATMRNNSGQVRIVIGKFSELAEMLNFERPEKDALVRSTISNLLDERKSAYLEEATRVIGTLYAHRERMSQGMRLTYSLRDSDNTENLLHDLAQQPTHRIVNTIGDYKTLAKDFNIDITDKSNSLPSKLAAINTQAKDAEPILLLQQGTVQTFLQLDNSAFFNDITNAIKLDKLSRAGQEHREPQLTDLIDEDVFTKSLTHHIENHLAVMEVNTRNAALSVMNSLLKRIAKGRG